MRHIFITTKKEFELPLGVIYIGRSPDCFIQLDETAASRIHIKITRTSQEVSVTDLGSLNGTFLNGARVHDTRRLQDGDMLRIADAYLVYKIKPATTEIAAPASAPLRTVELVFCPRCGGALVAGAEMCGHCAHSVPTVKAVNQAAVCGSCHAVQAKAARFCGNCGRETRVVKIGR